MKPHYVLAAVLGISIGAGGAHIYLLESKVEKLQKEVDALKDIQDGIDIHMRFLDSDNDRLRRLDYDLRTDIDNLKYQDGR